MIEPEVLYDKLASLAHYDDVAEFCRSAGVVGDTGNDTDCVLARLFRKEAGVRAVRVNADGIEWSKVDPPESDWWETSGWGESRKMTSALEVFVHEFDQNRYPDLVEEYECYD